MSEDLVAMVVVYCFAAIAAFYVASAWVFEALENRNGSRRAYWSRRALIRIALVLPITALWPLASLTLALHGLAGLVRDARGGPR